MKKINIVKKNIEFNNIINNGKKYYSDIFSIYVTKNNEHNRFGISVSKKIGNAVVRNKYKRRIKDIIDKYEFKYDGLNLIFISKLKLKDCDYNYIKDNIFKLLDKIGEDNEKKINQRY